MGDNIKQENNPEFVAERGKEFASRRRVIKGLAASVPVVMTITSGEAAAQASAYQCIANTPPTTPGSPPENSSIDDGWARSPNGKLIYVDLNGNPTNKSMGSPVMTSCYSSFV